MASTGEPYGLFWNSDNGDRTYDANSFEYWLKKFFTSGVFEGDLQVQASSGMTLVVGSGYANVDGKVKFWNAGFNLTLSPANSTYPRIDTIVITRDNVNRTITCEVVTGGYSGDAPQPTAPIRTAEIYQLVLAQIYVGNGVTEITQANITDTRPDTTLCGYIAGTVTEMDFSQFTAQFESYFAQFKTQHENEWSVWEQTQVAAYAAWFDNVKAEQIADKADWDAWYAALQEELHNLPADSAEYLQIQIDEIRENGTTGSIFHVTTTNTELEGKTLTVSCGTEIRTATFDSNLECTVIGFKSVGDVTFTSTDGIQTATKILDIDYYSKYEVPIAFWSATVNIQGDDNLKGATVTVKDSDNTTVATIVLNVITGQGVFSAQKADTYTFNYTFSSTDYSEELVVDEETTYSLELSAGFSWTTWVDTARDLDSSDYASLSEVLADEKALRELFLEHACVDYMAESTGSNGDLETVINNDYCAKWINLSDYALDFLGANTVIKALMDEADKYGYGEWVITDDTTTPPTWGPKGNVPVMTTNTAPYGTASASNASSGYEAYKVFDGSDSTYWVSGQTTTPRWIQYKFTNPVCVKKFKVHFNSNPTSTAYVVQGSNDGSTFTDISDSITDTAGIHEHNIDNENYYLYYRINITAQTTSGTIGQINVLQFYGRELKAFVPAMTSNTAPFGTASAKSSLNSSYLPWKVFDNDASTHWYSNANIGEKDSWVAYEFTSQTKLRMAIVVNSNSDSSNIATSGTINIKDESDNVLASDTFSGGTRFSKIFDISSDNVGTLFKCNIVGNNGLGVTLTTVQFYGLDYSEKEFEVGTTKKWLYDHGVELEPLGEGIISGTNSVATKENEQLYIYLSGTSKASAFMTTSPIDMTPYKLMMGVLGNKYYASTGNNPSTAIGVKSTRTHTSSDYTLIASVNFVHGTNAELKKGVDLSSVTGQSYPIYRVYTTSSSATHYGTLTEWWLE